MTEGYENLEKNIAKLRTLMPKQAKKAVTEVTVRFSEKLAQNTPATLESDGTHARDDIKNTPFRGQGIGVIEKDVGYGKKTGWRVHFADKGTVYQSAQNFEQKTINQMRPEALQIYQKYCREVLQL
ncbi:HK97-gp10 family putative phage morphogenesis protein [Listeria seeligeri]|uniref:HK97-gp10 family putative phage morphogenesis protein n=1 Tax=Listeria seeligeri TaxID=1640 RepID=UPI0022EB0278|nr:HK97-gp10 family putative phage morphogenesis protein [Listeria seeligeri]